MRLWKRAAASPRRPLETRKTVTVLFCDVTGSTSPGERQAPEQVRRVLSRYYEVSRDVLQRHGGTVEKFMGAQLARVRLIGHRGTSLPQTLQSQATLLRSRAGVNAARRRR